MSLGKLLATGRSLAGGPSVGRYNVRSVNRLPKFGSGKNPFARPAAVAAPARNAEVAPTPVVPDLAIAPAATPAPAAKPNAAVEHKKTQRIAGLVWSTQARKWFGRVKLGAVRDRMNFRKRRTLAKATADDSASLPVPLLRRATKYVAALAQAALVFVKRLAVAVRDRSLASWSKLVALFQKWTGRLRRRPSQSVFPRYGKPAVQTELSLDKVTVVRNDLEESDLEIVMAKTDTSTQVAPSVAPATPNRGPVPPALKKMTSRLLGVKLS